MVPWPPAPTEVAERGNAHNFMLRVCWLWVVLVRLSYFGVCAHAGAVDLRGCCFVCEIFMGPRLMAIGGCGWIV